MLKKWYWRVRGFLYGLFNPSAAHKLKMEVRLCEACDEEQLCEVHSQQVHEEVYG